jgi:hypothetical protein
MPTVREGVKKFLNEQKGFPQRRKVAESAMKTNGRSLRYFAPWRLGVRLFVFHSVASRCKAGPPSRSCGFSVRLDRLLY